RRRALDGGGDRERRVRGRPRRVRPEPPRAGGARGRAMSGPQPRGGDRLAILAPPDSVATALERELTASRRVLLTCLASPAELVEAGREVPGLDLVVYRPALCGARDGRPDLDQAAAVLAACAEIGAPRLILVASAARCQPLHAHPGFVPEERC